MGGCLHFKKSLISVWSSKLKVYNWSNDQIKWILRYSTWEIWRSSSIWGCLHSEYFFFRFIWDSSDTFWNNKHDLNNNNNILWLMCSLRRLLGVWGCVPHLFTVLRYLQPRTWASPKLSEDDSGKCVTLTSVSPLPPQTGSMLLSSLESLLFT